MDCPRIIPGFIESEAAIAGGEKTPPSVQIFRAFLQRDKYHFYARSSTETIKTAVTTTTRKKLTKNPYE